MVSYFAVALGPDNERPECGARTSGRFSPACPVAPYLARPVTSEVEIREHPAGGLAFRVFAKTRASRSRVSGVRQGVLEVALAAPPVDGEANVELVRVISRALHVPKSAVRIVSGARSRTKLLLVSGVSEHELRSRLGVEMGSGVQ